MNGADDLLSLLRLVTDPGAVTARLAELQAKEAAIDAREQGAIEREVMSDQRLAAADQREAKVRELEFQAHTENLRLEAIRIELVDFARILRETDDQIKTRLLRHAGLLTGFNPQLQTMPNWDSIESSIFGRPADVHFDDDSVGGVVEPVPDASREATITRTRRPMRRGEERV